ncbi:MAG: hypothetical protein AAF889_05150 [Cyanobacteria bacterium P01_D01_bin.73]
MDIDRNIKQANDALKAARQRVRIRRKRYALFLRATLPPKPGSDRADSYRQEVSLGVSATPKGLKRAIAEAHKMAAQLDLKEFDWGTWIDCPSHGVGVLGATAVEKFIHYKQPLVKGSTWEKVYKYPLRAIPQDEPLTEELARGLIENYSAASRMRQHWLSVLSQLLAFNEIPFDFKDLKGTYRRPVGFRKLPTDEAIATMRNGIKNPGHQYIFGLLATFGLRDHEAFFLDPEFLKKGTAFVLDGKTGNKGPRQVWPYHPEWWEEWELWDYDRCPQYSGPHNAALGQRVAQFFYRLKKAGTISCDAYDLRHAWAIRTIRYGLPVELAARQMGHSLEIHTETYHHWINTDVQQQIHETLINRSDRPRPPVV